MDKEPGPWQALAIELIVNLICELFCGLLEAL
jgi:hypothetical protein